jgi:hypothetical protein
LRNNTITSAPTIARAAGTSAYIARCVGGAGKGEIEMELYFMVLAILLLTLIASCAIRQAEEEMIERHELDRHARKPSPAQSNRESSDDRERADVVGYLRPQQAGHNGP